MSGAETNERVVKFIWEGTKDLFCVTHGGQIAMDLIPPGVQSLAGTPLEDHILVLAKCVDEDGNVGTLTEIEAGIDGRADYGLDIFLLIVMPKRGMLLTRALKKGRLHPESPDVTAAFEQVKKTGEWVGKLVSVTTNGPLEGGYGEVIAATGEFAGMKGRQQQTVHWRRITPSIDEQHSEETFWLTPA